DRVVLYTDGITDVFDSHGEILGIQGLQEFVRQTALLPFVEMKKGILDRVAAWRDGPPGDDMSLVIVEFRSLACGNRHLDRESGQAGGTINAYEDRKTVERTSRSFLRRHLHLRSGVPSSRRRRTVPIAFLHPTRCARQGQKSRHRKRGLRP